MLRTELGDARFWKAIRHYVQKHAGGSVETRDLARAVEEATGWNVDRFFDQWVFRAGHPELKVEYSLGRRARSWRAWRSSRRRRSKGETPLFHLPLPVRFVVDGEVHDVTLIVCRQAEETFFVPLAGKPSQVIVDPGQRIS